MPKPYSASASSWAQVHRDERDAQRIRLAVRLLHRGVADRGVTDADDDRPAARITADDDNATVVVGGQGDADRPEQQSLHATEATGADDDRRGVLTHFQQRACGVALADAGADPQVWLGLQRRGGGVGDGILGLTGDRPDDLLRDDQPGGVIARAGVVGADDAVLNPPGPPATRPIGRRAVRYRCCRLRRRLWALRSSSNGFTGNWDPAPAIPSWSQPVHPSMKAALT